MKNIKDICHAFWILEKKYNLIDFEIQGVKPWQYKRMNLYYTIGQKTGLLDPQNAVPQKNRALNSKLKKLKTIGANPFLSPRKDILLFSHPRIQQVGRKHIDIYTHYFAQQLSEKGISFCEIGIHTPQRSKQEAHNLYSVEFLRLLSLIFRKFFTVDLKPSAAETIQRLSRETESTFNVSLDFNEYFINSVITFKAYYRIFSLLLKKIKPKKIYIVVSYAELMMPLIKAAKDMKIPVYEFQHGTFSRYHLGYSYPGRKSLDYFPDYFLVWSNFWKELIPLPIKYENIIVDTNRHLDFCKMSYKSVQKKTNQAVVISQWAIGHQIAERILQNWNYFRNYKIKYKLHPGEYENWEKYPALVKLVKENKIDLIKSCNLNKLLMESEYQIGVFSTALYEGAEFGCKTILINLPGIEYMDKFIQVNQDDVTTID